MHNDKLLDEYRASLDEIDEQMAKLFEERMKTVGVIAAYKKENGLPVADSKREAEMLRKNSHIVDAPYRDYYAGFLRSVTGLSKDFQRELNACLTANGAPVYIERGASVRLNKYINTGRRAFIVTDSGVPSDYVKSVAAQFASSFVFTFNSGEASKNTETYFQIIKALSDNNFCRADVVAAVGGGVAGDIAGFAASTYMRGLPFVNIPTTLLAQVDSSIGGKTGIDFNSYKNQIGTFYRPEAVITDPALLETLSPRQFACGMAECIKIALTCDGDLFTSLENGDIPVDEIIRRCVLLKIKTVEADEKENGIRKLLNFGHTIGHAVESLQGENGLLHGECVAVGMLPMCSCEIRPRLERVLKKYCLPTEIKDGADIVNALLHDKKSENGSICTVRVEKCGEYIFKNSDVDEIVDLFKEVYGL